MRFWRSWNQNLFLDDLINPRSRFFRRMNTGRILFYPNLAVNTMLQHNQNAIGPIKVYNLTPPRQSNYDEKGSIPYMKIRRSTFWTKLYFGSTYYYIKYCISIYFKLFLWWLRGRWSYFCRLHTVLYNSDRWFVFEVHQFFDIGLFQNQLCVLSTNLLSLYIYTDCN